MIHRIAGATILVLVTVVAPINAAEASGRSFHGVIRAPAARPIINHAIVDRMPLKDVRSSRMRDRDRAGVPAWYGYPPDIPSVQPQYVVPVENGPPPILEPISPPAGHQPGCHAESQSVPSESGGQATIRVTRCY